MVSKLVPEIRQKSKLLVNQMDSDMVGLYIHILGLKNSSMLGATPKKSTVIFQFQRFEIN